MKHVDWNWQPFLDSQLEEDQQHKPLCSDPHQIVTFSNYEKPVQKRQKLMGSLELYQNEKGRTAKRTTLLITIVADTGKKKSLIHTV